MPPLQAQLNRIWKAILDKHNWPKYRADLKERGWTKGSMALATAKIKNYLNAPILETFDNLKEEAAKFLVSRYHNMKIWLDEPIEINLKFVNFIAKLSVKGGLAPVRVKNLALIEKFTGSSNKGKNSKGFPITSIKMPTNKWVSIIISMFLKILGWSFDVKLNLLEAIDNIAYNEKYTTGFPILENC